MPAIAIVCYSGGHSSALAAYEAVRKYGKRNVILLNHDMSSKVEHADIKRYKQDMAEYLDIPITYVNMDNFEAMTPLAVCRSIGIFQRQPGPKLCTYYLKTLPFYAWLDKNYPASADKPNRDIVFIYGFDETEITRIERRREAMQKKGYQVEFPLLQNRTITSTEEIGIARPSTYSTFNHANCIGCLKAGRQHWYCTYCLRPDIWEEAKEAESEIGHSIIKGAYLWELESMFYSMREVGIPATEKIHPARFWADAKKVVLRN